jgi:hypothetical protein
MRELVSLPHATEIASNKNGYSQRGSSEEGVPVCGTRARIDQPRSNRDNRYPFNYSSRTLMTRRRRKAFTNIVFLNNVILLQNECGPPMKCRLR